MTLSTELDIYKQATALLDLAVDVQATIPRAFRSSMGSRIADECVEVLVLIARANAARQPEDRAVHIGYLLERLEVATYLLRASHNKRLISHALWASSITLTSSVGKQANGWLKNARERMGQQQQPRNPSAAPAA